MIIIQQNDTCITFIFTFVSSYPLILKMSYLIFYVVFLHCPNNHSGEYDIRPQQSTAMGNKTKGLINWGYTLHNKAFVSLAPHTVSVY